MIPEAHIFNLQLHTMGKPCFHSKHLMVHTTEYCRMEDIPNAVSIENPFVFRGSFGGLQTCS